jgi:hypothetical protein
MKSSILLLLFFTLTLSADKPGLKVAIHHNEITDLKKHIIPEIMSQLKDLNAPDIDLVIPGTEIGIKVHKIHSHLYDILQEDIQVDFIPDSSTVKVLVKDISAYWEANIEANLIVIKRSAYASIHMNNLGFSFQVLSGAKEGRATVQITDFKVDLQKKTFDFIIRGDFFAELLERLANMLEDAAVAIVKAALEQIIPGTLNTLFSFILETIPQKIELGPIGLTYYIPEPPAIKDNFFCTGISAYLYPVDDPKKPEFEPVDMMDYDPDCGQNLQFFLSDYTIKSAIHAMHEIDILNFNMTTQFLWGDHDFGCWMTEKPEFKFNTSVISYTGASKCKVVLFNEGWFKDNLHFSIGGAIEFKMRQLTTDTHIAFLIDIFELSDFFVQFPFLDYEFSLNWLLYLLNDALDLISEEINKHLEKLKLPLPTIDGLGVDDNKEELQEGFLQIAFTPKLDFSTYRAKFQTFLAEQMELAREQRYQERGY